MDADINFFLYVCTYIHTCIHTVTCRKRELERYGRNSERERQLHPNEKDRQGKRGGEREEEGDKRETEEREREREREREIEGRERREIEGRERDLERERGR